MPDTAPTKGVDHARRRPPGRHHARHLPLGHRRHLGQAVHVEQLTRARVGLAPLGVALDFRCLVRGCGEDVLRVGLRRPATRADDRGGCADLRTHSGSRVFRHSARGRPGSGAAHRLFNRFLGKAVHYAHVASGSGNATAPGTGSDATGPPSAYPFSPRSIGLRSPTGSKTLAAPWFPVKCGFL